MNEMPSFANTVLLSELVTYQLSPIDTRS